MACLFRRVLICIAISISLMRAARRSNRYIRELSSPFAAPIDVCFQNKFSSRRNTPISTRFSCQEVCDGVGDSKICSRQVVQHRFDSSDCSGTIREQNFFKCPTPFGDFVCNCYEDEEYNGELASPDDYEPGYVIANLTRGHVPPPSAVETILNETNIEPEDCVREENFEFYREFVAVTNTCYFVNRTNIDLEWGWFRVRCDNDSVALDFFDNEYCNGTQKPGYPIVQHNGCRLRPFYGHVWWAEVVECYEPVPIVSGGESLSAHIYCSLMLVFVAGLWSS